MSFQQQYGRQHSIGSSSTSSETSVDNMRITSLHSHPLCTSMPSLVPQATMNDYSSRSYDNIYNYSNNNNTNHRRRCYSLSTCQSYNNNTNFDKDEVQQYQQSHQVPIQSQSQFQIQSILMDMISTTTTTTSTNVDEPLTSRIFMQPSMLLLQFGFSYLFQKRQTNTISSTNYLSLSTVVGTIVFFSLSSHIFRRSIRKRQLHVVVHDSSIIPTTCIQRDSCCFRQPVHTTTGSSNNDDNNNNSCCSTLLMIPDTILNIVLVLIMIQQSEIAYQLLFIVSTIMIFVAIFISTSQYIQQRTVEYTMSDITLRHALLGFEYIYYNNKR